MTVPTFTIAQCNALAKAGDWFAAGFFTGGRNTLTERMAQGMHSAMSRMPLPAYTGERLYPLAPLAWAAPQAVMHWHYVAPSIRLSHERQAIIAATTDSDLREAYTRMDAFFTEYLRDVQRLDDPGHGLAGAGWTHSTVQYCRILKEGLDGYWTRINDAAERNTADDAQALYHGLTIVLDAISVFARRMGNYLRELSFADPFSEERRCFLAAHFLNGLSYPASSFRAAMTTTTFIYVLDGCDSLGRIDQFLWPFYQRDIEAGVITSDEASAMLRELWELMDHANGWNVSLGGSTPDGREASNEFTRLCLEAAHGMRRPNLALRLRDDTPEDVWDAALETIRTGNGLPALYSEDNFLRAMDAAHLGLSTEDARDYAFGGCTELMIQGASNVGSLDYDLNVAKILDEALQGDFPADASFDDVYAAFRWAYRAHIRGMVEFVNRQQRWRAMHAPQLLRTLFTDDCIARGKNFQDGGARYNWSIINIGGLSNVVDALAALREVVYDTGEILLGDLLQALRMDFTGYEALRARLARCPRFGNDYPEVDALARRLSGDIYRELQLYAPWRGGKFLAGTLMFVTYGMAGATVGALPDGRRAGDPLADSAGPVQGRDRSGPTAMLCSVTRLHQSDAPGTLVVNLRLSPTLFTTSEGRERVKALIRTYFELGGMQLQINVVDQAVLRDAIAHPERHGDLVIRVGGYSEYFTRLDAVLQQTVLERTEHA